MIPRIRIPKLPVMQISIAFSALTVSILLVSVVLVSLHQIYRGEITVMAIGIVAVVGILNALEYDRRRYMRQRALMELEKVPV